MTTSPLPRPSPPPEARPRPSRRRLLGSLLAAPAALAIGRAVHAGLQAVPFLRPPSAGTSATRCAQCGASGHSMLDPTCPAAPRVV